jgi:membrane protease YdiL (CAAX protease family)
MGDLRALAPVTPKEGRAFALVAVTAGVCEEIMYRGILMSVLTPVVGLWPAVGLSSVIFGMGHAYQGFSGIVKTTLVGLIMALLTVFSGSLLVAMVLHTVIDLASGRMMGAALRAENKGHGPEETPTGMLQTETP